MDFQKCKTCGERHRIGPCHSLRSVKRGPEEGARKGGARVSGVVGAKYESETRTPPPLQVPLSRRGRPRIGEPHIKAEPWKALGMSERTYYRRQAEKRAKS